MTESEKEMARKVLDRQRAGWAYLEAERLAGLVNTVTKDVLPAFQSSFTYSQTLPPRLDSGFTEFYAALGRGRKNA